MFLVCITNLGSKPRTSSHIPKNYNADTKARRAEKKIKNSTHYPGLNLIEHQWGTVEQYQCMEAPLCNPHDPRSTANRWHTPQDIPHGIPSAAKKVLDRRLGCFLGIVSTRLDFFSVRIQGEMNLNFP